jgi:hypothetical protein
VRHVFSGQQILLVAARKVISNEDDLNRKGEKRRDSKETFRYGVSRRVKGFASRDWHIRFLRGAIRGLGFAC